MLYSFKISYQTATLHALFNISYTQRLGTNVVYQRFFFLRKTVNLFWFCILQMFLEISKSTTKNQKKLNAFKQMFHNVIFCLEILSTYGSTLSGWILCQKVATFLLTLSTCCIEIKISKVNN